MGYGGYVNETGTTLYIYGWQGTDDRNTLYSLDLTDPNASVIKLFDNGCKLQCHRRRRDHGRPRLVRLALGPPKVDQHRIGLRPTRMRQRKVVMVDASAPQEERLRSFRSPSTLRGVGMVGGHLVVHAWRTPSPSSRCTTPTDSTSATWTCQGSGPPTGSAASPTKPRPSTASPPTIRRRSTSTTSQRVSVNSGRPDVPFDPKQFETKQVPTRAKTASGAHVQSTKRA